VRYLAKKLAVWSARCPWIFLWDRRSSSLRLEKVLSTSSLYCHNKIEKKKNLEELDNWEYGGRT
jgi:hypothetical protein